MMRLPTFRYCAPKTPEEVVSVLRDEGPAAHVVAGGTDLFPNMKRRQHEPKTVVSLRRVDALRGLAWEADGSLRIGPAETLRAVERDPGVKERLPGLWQAVVSISTPILRNMGTIGGNVCLDTRCNYLNQNFEWRRAIHHCLKCSGDTCWTAPGGTRCWAVNSSDTVPLMIVLGARFRLLGPDGTREIDAADMYASVDDGREWLTRRPDELLTDIVIPPQGEARSTYVKLRRRAAFDFPVLGVAARIEGNGRVERADLVLNALGPAPIRCLDAERALVGGPLTDESIAEAADLAPRAARPLDNTDHMPSWRKKMVRVHVQRALEALR